MAERVGETETDARWLKRGDMRSGRWKIGSESSEREKVKKCVQRHDKDETRVERDNDC